SMPPPVVPAWPFLIVKPEIVTVRSEETIRKTRLVIPPSIASTSAPVPLIVTLVFTSNSPLVSIMTPEMPVASIVSPSFAIASASRKEPGPSSLVLVTVIVVARAEIVRAQAQIKQTSTALNLLTLLLRTILGKLQPSDGNVIVTSTNHRFHRHAQQTAFR